mmetsp:Transcript_1706/g.2523  ORF Transcript_1706/g.2523 Transcript_1706/m.2523 type:complete len:729 (+) Transcript_1706:110-2296(+)
MALLLGQGKRDKRGDELQVRIKELEAKLKKAKEELAKHSGEISTSAAQLSPAPVSHKGYLYRWLDRTIGWGGTKWSLRFVSLERGRIAYFGSHRDADPRYMLGLRGCAVRDEGYKPNKRFKIPGTPSLTTPGAYFHVFCIYTRAIQNFEDEDDEIEISPLLRFSTASLAEKTQWMTLISEGCAYADTDAFLEGERALQEEEERQREQQLSMANAMPQAKRGTLPPLYFGKVVTPAATLKRTPSGLKLQRKSSFYRTKAKDSNAELVDKSGYPPSKPMHREAAPSYLSEEAPVQNYRGFFNLMVIILAVSHLRLILDTIKIHGLFLDSLMDNLSSFAVSDNKLHEYPILTGFLAMQVFILLAYVIENVLSRQLLPNWLGMLLHQVNAHACLLLSCGVVYLYVDDPLSGAILLFHMVILWMKLLSYALANEDYRACSDDDHISTLQTLVKDLDTTVNVYPGNVTISDLYYFWFAPTLTYQIAFPRSDRIRVWKVISLVLRFILIFSLMYFLTAQVVTPNLRQLVKDLETTDGKLTLDLIAEYGMRLAIANTYLWLLMFYGYFHVFLNITGELLRFGDRVFYKDWWNSSDVSSYWRLWNTPVHYWLVRHWYFPLVRRGLSKTIATLLVFFLSAVMHEVIISLPFHMIRPWAYLGMMGQVPLAWITKYLTKKLPGTSLGNVIFWLSFCVVGQPMAILLYTIDYQFQKETDGNHVLTMLQNLLSKEDVASEEL